MTKKEKKEYYKEYRQNPEYKKRMANYMRKYRQRPVLCSKCKAQIA